ncbi:MAG: M24 family metallopeptidase [Oscillospiraceae bacterium]
MENVHIDTGTAFQSRSAASGCLRTREIQKIEQAQALTESTFSHILSVIRAGVTEREIALEMEFFMRRQGADGVSFDFIVVSGNNSSLPHGVPTGKAVEKGDFITMDFGALVDGYHSDMTRTIAVGCVDEEQRRVYDTVLRAQRAALSAIRAGMRCSDADRAAREVIDGAGYAGCFGHGLGHGVGVEIHEAPNLSPRSAEILEPGMVVTVEPGIYIENRYGVRIEDMVVVQKGGCRNLTASPKELIIL